MADNVVSTADPLTEKAVVTRNRRPFLTARWENLALLTYAVPAELLLPHLPPNCELDLLDGRAIVSLVAFDFRDTRVLGIPWPGYRNFPEINLRFYVRCGKDRGVCFIREFVPKRAIALLAKWIYNEPYHHAKMSSKTREDENSIVVEHELRFGKSRNLLRITASKPAVIPDESSVEHFLKEHRWGFGIARNGQLLRYEVIHPTWEIWPVQSHELPWDWAAVYGEQWAFLKSQQPISVILARGSKVSVSPKWVANPGIESPAPTVLFDGVCNLCNGWVDFILRHERVPILKFASLQSEFGKSASVGSAPLSTVILLENGRLFMRSTAALRIVRYLRRPWNWLAIFRVIPPPLRNLVYDWIARNRYKWFGKSDACRVMNPELRDRFLG